ncbi:helix-turn-helix domain-containing protein [Litorihabitans aurantiacus]|uniref:XRE family transcriptional regulator n=1 Tax=Litorihabitans aurantiacus TaxID=1930061 RepID=A0AA37UM49_9MICO|nr:XRE family transcriptional regulator [Litorihabitans aurantiacus]GMA31030.1 XRE family transcriptional regulator [Litorihabitans aurantiacus]
MTSTDESGWTDADRRLGQAIRRTRHARGLTLVQVAAEAGLSHPFLSQLERGLARPSMRSLFVIAEALGTTQQALLAEAGAAEPIDIDAGGGARLLGPLPPDVAVTEFVGPQGDFGDFFRHDHAELLYVVAGSVEVEHEGRPGGSIERRTLGPRETAGYPGGVAHRFRQVGEQTAVLLVVHGGVGA